MEECYILVKLQASSCNFTKSSNPRWVFYAFLSCTNGTNHVKHDELSSIVGTE